MNRWRLAARALMVLMVLLGLGAIWWWALFGMTSQIGVAVAATAVAGFLVGLVGAIP